MKVKSRRPASSSGRHHRDCTEVKLVFTFLRTKHHKWSHGVWQKSSRGCDIGSGTAIFSQGQLTGLQAESQVG